MRSCWRSWSTRTTLPCWPAAPRFLALLRSPHRPLLRLLQRRAFCLLGLNPPLIPTAPFSLPSTKAAARRRGVPEGTRSAALAWLAAAYADQGIVAQQERLLTEVPARWGSLREVENYTNACALRLFSLLALGRFSEGLQAAQAMASWAAQAKSTRATAHAAGQLMRFRRARRLRFFTRAPFVLPKTSKAKVGTRAQTTASRVLTGDVEGARAGLPSLERLVRQYRALGESGTRGVEQIMEGVLLQARKTRARERVWGGKARRESVGVERGGRLCLFWIWTPGLGPGLAWGSACGSKPLPPLPFSFPPKKAKLLLRDEASAAADARHALARGFVPAFSTAVAMGSFFALDAVLSLIEAERRAQGASATQTKNSARPAPLSSLLPAIEAAVEGLAAWATWSRPFEPSYLFLLARAALVRGGSAPHLARARRLLLDAARMGEARGALFAAARARFELRRFCGGDEAAHGSELAPHLPGHSSSNGHLPPPRASGDGPSSDLQRALELFQACGAAAWAAAATAELARGLAGGLGDLAGGLAAERASRGLASSRSSFVLPSASWDNSGLQPAVDGLAARLGELASGSGRGGGGGYSSDSSWEEDEQEEFFEPGPLRRRLYRLANAALVAGAAGPPRSQLTATALAAAWRAALGPESVASAARGSSSALARAVLRQLEARLPQLAAALQVPYLPLSIPSVCACLLFCLWAPPELVQGAHRVLLNTILSLACSTTSIRCTPMSRS